MVRYELKKILGTTGGKVALVLMAAVVLVTFWFAGPCVEWINEQGESETGFAAIAQLRQAKKAWAGPLDEEKLQAVIRENQRINATPEATSKDYHQNDIAYGWKQGFADIRNLLNYSFADGYRSYDYYVADSITAEGVKDFYPNRVKLLKHWLNDPSDAGYYRFNDAEKDFLIAKYESLETPMKYNYISGWDSASEHSITITMLCAIVLGYLIAGIFSNEFKWRSDSIFFSSLYGRNQAVWAKIKAGFLLVTLVYWISMFSYSLLTLTYLGFDGWDCPIQITRWKSMYNITYGELYLLIILGGYLANLFISFLVMWVSAKTKTSLLAVTIPFVVCFLPIFLQDFEEAKIIGKLLSFLPDRLLTVSYSVSYLDLLSIGKTVVAVLPVCFLLYSILTLLLVPAMYRTYRHKQIS